MAFDKIQDFSSSFTPVNAWGWYGDRDLIFGGSAGDTLAGGEGSDEIHGGSGADEIIDQTHSFNGVFLGSLGFGFTPEALGEPEESWFADRYNNTLSLTYYSGGNDRYFGDGGNDTIAGLEGDDFLDGGADDDVVWGAPVTIR
jgi:Ca2+-binding RTX toxin-like protein